MFHHHSNTFLPGKVADSEMDRIRELAQEFPRHAAQLNRLLEADAEILDFKDRRMDFLVVKTDGIYEEIRKKLYEDPVLIGWMAITVTMSDLAAVGADPLGLLLSLQLPEPLDEAWLAGFQQGVGEACSAYGVPVLGGDTNGEEAISVLSTGIATIHHTRPLMRKPMSPGEHLYATGSLGLGSAFAYARYFDNRHQVAYKPLARLKESKLIRQHASACMDTSDGLFPALSVLAALNNIGIKLTTPVEKALHSEVLPVYKTSHIPAWIFLAGPHGEYELLFSIPAERKEAFEQACAHDHWHPLHLGEVTAEPFLQFVSEEVEVRCAPALIANLFGEAKGDVQRYMEMLLKQHKSWLL